MMRQRGADVLTGAACVVPVPLHPSRRRHRGFNQAADLARTLGLPLVHALRRARALAEKQAGAAKVFPRQVLDLFQGALQARDRFLGGEMGAAALEQAHTRYVAQLLDLSGRPRANEANQAFANHLYNHGEQWLMFLVDPSIPATNHRAEQALKVPIVNRKVWGGNRTAAGAEAHATSPPTR